MNILGIDFGPTQGYCKYWQGGGYKVWEVEYGRDGHGRMYHDLQSYTADGQTIIVGERFMYLKDEAQTRDKIDYLPAEYVGVCKLFCIRHDIKVHWQTSAQAVGKSAFFGDGSGGNDKIKKLGLWVPNKKHGRDALRHVLYRQVFHEGRKDILERLR